MSAFYLLESPVGIAMFKLESNDLKLVDKQLLNLETGTADYSIGEFVKKNCPANSTLQTLDPDLINELSGTGITVVSEPDEFSRKIKNNPFKYFGVCKKIFAMCTARLAHGLIDTDRNDLIMIDIINSIEEMDTSINNRVMRVREWYSLHFPELSKVSDHGKYIECLLAVGNRARFTASEHPGVADDIAYLAKNSMGSDLADEDLARIRECAERIRVDIEYRNSRQKLLRAKGALFPNLVNLVGEIVTAKLIRRAGSITQLAVYPSSTIQILGAERAYNEAVKARTNTPKYGLIYDSPLVSGASEHVRGVAARMLSNKIALCARIDSDPTRSGASGEFGESARKKLLARISQLAEGQAKKQPTMQKKRVVSVKEYDVSRDSVKRVKK